MLLNRYAQSAVPSEVAYADSSRTDFTEYNSIFHKLGQMRKL